MTFSEWLPLYLDQVWWGVAWAVAIPAGLVIGALTSPWRSR